MNEPRVVESVTNECQLLGRAHESSSARAEQLIACLEGEIAKRDETIARLEPQLNRAIQANYDLREELAACRVAVENCEVFRARIAELEDLVLSLQCKAIESDDLRAELSALKAQDPVAWVGAIEYGVPLLMVEPQNWKATPLYAAPVSEAKAQGVVMPEPDFWLDGGATPCYYAEPLRAVLNAAPAALAADAGYVFYGMDGDHP